MVIDYKREKLHIGSCRNMQISIIVTLVKNKMKRAMRALSRIVILIRSITMILVQFRGSELSKDRNLLFISTKDSARFEINDEVFSHVINVNLCAI